MRTTRITQLALFLHYNKVLTEHKSVQSAMDSLRRENANFYQPGFTEPVLEPTFHIDEEGDPFMESLDIAHRLLTAQHISATPGASEVIQRFGRGTFWHLHDTKSVIISQGADFVDSPNPDLLANGLLAFSLRCYVALHPSYGWIDEWGWNLPDGAQLKLKFPKFLFWANVFGPEYVKAIGRDFLLKAPGWSIVDLDDGGMLYVATESYRHWWGNDQGEILAYFKTKMPKIQIYRAQPIPY